MDIIARGMAADSLIQGKAYTEQIAAAGITSVTYNETTSKIIVVYATTPNPTTIEYVIPTIVGNGIASTTLNEDYTLTITYTNGQTYTTSSIRGAQGPQGDPGKTQDVYFNGASKLDAQNIARIEVNPNQTEQTTAKLTKLKIDGINYALQGGGASVYANISAMVTDFNTKAKEDLELGWNIYIRTINVPDLWVSKNDETTSVPYTYTTDAQFIADLNTASSTGLQIGYYRVNALESEKVNVPVTDVQQDGVTIVYSGIANMTPKTSTTLPATMVSRTQYILGNKASTFAMTLPTAKAQDYIIVDFNATGSFTPTCSVTLKGDTIPSTTSGKHYSFLFTYNGTNWVFSYLYY